MKRHRYGPQGEIGHRRRDWISGAVGAVLGGLVTWLVTQAAAGENVDRLEAEAFIATYYRNAVDDPSLAWRMLDERQQATHNGGYAEFERYWRQWTDVEHRRVQTLPDARNYFTVEVAYVNQEGTRQSYRPIQFRLVCDDAWANRLEFVTCGAEDLLLHDSLNLPATSQGAGTD